MTVCLAAASTVANCIVNVSDMKLGSVDMSMDQVTFRGYGIGKNWLVQYSGSDISEVTPIINSVRKLLHESKPYPTELITAAMRNAYSREVATRSENKFLKPINFTWDSFKKEGYQQLGSEAFSRLLYAIEEEAIDLQFLVSGFNERGHADIFTITHPGKVTYYTELGFWAIGSGQTNALASFFNSRTVPAYLSKYDLLYRCCEAKFNAENAEGVGEQTIAFVKFNDGKSHPLIGSNLREIRNIWQRSRILTVPEAGTKAAQDALDAVITRSKQSASQKLEPKP